MTNRNGGRAKTKPLQSVHPSTALGARNGISQMTPREQLICFVAAGKHPTDPIRIMKGLFVFTMAAKENSNLGVAQFFNFSAMDYGPCAPEIYRTLDALKEQGQIEKLPVPGETWCRVAPTAAGIETANTIQQKNPVSAQFLSKLRTWTDEKSFTSLLQAIYTKWPDYAKNSVLPHLRPNG